MMSPRLGRALADAVSPGRAAFQTTILAALMVSLLALPAVVGAQDDGAAEAPKAPVKPRPSELMPRASERLLLDVVNDGEHLIAVGERGHILASNDGVKWAQVAVPVRATLTALTFLDARTGYAVGHDATILRTDDGGRSWQMQNFEPEKENAFLDVLFTDRNHGYAVGAFGSFYGTTDGGANWGEVDAPAVREEELYFHCIAKLGDGSIFIAGETGMLGVARSDGSAWTRLKSPYEGTFFGALPHGPKGAIVFGLRGNVFVSDDVRTNVWRALPTQSQASFYGGTRLADGRSVLVGSGGEVLLIDAAARAVRPLRSGVSFSLAAVAAYGNHLVLVGENGNKAIVLP